MNYQLKGEVEMEKKITKAELVGFLKRMLSTNQKWATSALIRIYDNQTLDEQNSGETYHQNGIGFAGCDAPILTSFAEFYKSRGFLTGKQMTYVFKKMGKYANQLARESYFSWDKLEVCYRKSIAA